MTTIEETLQNIDWELYLKQKEALFRVIREFKDGSKTAELLDGILNFMDAIQDAAEHEGYTKYPSIYPETNGGTK
jgi:hypothetical protein